MQRFLPLATSTFVLYAASSLAQDDGPERDLGERSVRLYLAHMIFMILAWLLLVPAAILIARFGRSYFNWFPHHRNIQIGTLIFITIGIALGIAAMFAEGAKQWNEDHHRVGLSIFILAWLQAILGYARHALDNKYLGYAHIPIGLLLFGLAMWNIQTGFELWGWEAGMAPRIFVYVWMGFLILLYGIGCLLIPKQIKSIREGDKLNSDGEKASPVSSLNQTQPATTNHTTVVGAQ